MTDALAGQIITGVVTLGVAFFGYLKLKAGQKQVEGKVDSYKKDVDGMKTELIAATKGQYQAEGELKGKADQKIIEKANQEDKDAAVSIALNTTPPTSDKVLDVKIVDQEKVIKVGIEKDKPKN